MEERERQGGDSRLKGGGGARGGVGAGEAGERKRKPVR
jgi:hypothetical protein